RYYRRQHGPGGVLVGEPVVEGVYPGTGKESGVGAAAAGEHVICPDGRQRQRQAIGRAGRELVQVVISNAVAINAEGRKQRDDLATESGLVVEGNEAVGQFVKGYKQRA